MDKTVQLKEDNLAPLLPYFLNLRGSPYTIQDHFVMEPLFNARIPWRTLYKCGRQVSKCVGVDQQIERANGAPVRAGDVSIGDTLLSIDDSTLKSVTGRVIGLHRSIRSDMFQVTTRMGSQLVLSGDHRIRTLYGYTPLKDLSVGARIASIRKGGAFGRHSISSDRIAFTAYMIGDGSCGVSGNFNFTNASDEALQEVEKIAEREEEPTRSNPKPGNSASSISFRHVSLFAKWMKEDGLWGRRSYEKKMPTWVFQLSEADTWLFVSRLWATDGCIKAPRTISYCTTSFSLARDLRVLLRKLGVTSSIKQRRTSLNGQACRDAYTVRLEGRKSLQLFRFNAKVPGKPIFPASKKETRNNRHTIPREINHVLKKLAAPKLHKHDKSLRKAGLRATAKYSLSDTKLQQYIDHFRDSDTKEYQFLVSLRDGDVLWDEITSITPLNEMETVDFEIDTYHNFSVDGIVTHNSTSLAAQGFIQTASTPYFNTLYVLPLYEMCRRFSSNVVRPFIEESEIKNYIVDTRCEQSVLQKTFTNRSIMFFTFAFLDCDRTRGVSADKLGIDEVQDMDWDFIPIIRETLSASKWGLEQYSGTPKTFDNTIEGLWDDSSQAEWFIRCGCGHWNIPSTQYDAMKMIGPVGNIKKHGTALQCAKCGKPIDSRNGRWVHAYPDRYDQFAGYHVPQIVLPMHYSNEKKWVEFLRKRDRSAPNVFLNECMGESCDVGTKLVTLDELKNACLLHKLDFNTCRNLDFTNRYIQRILGVDWGGGGEEEVSFTTIAVIGLRPDYSLELLWGERMHSAVNDVEEVRRIQELFQIFQCHYIAHDFGGSGSVHETLLIQSGFPLSRVIPFSYVRTGSKALIRHHAPSASSNRHFYSLDKTWSLMLLCLLLKTKHLTLTEYESSKNLVEDFLHIYEEKSETASAGDILTVKRKKKQSDDFVHSVNFACCGHFHVTQKPPRFADQFGLTLTDEQREVAHPTHHVRF